MTHDSKSQEVSTIETKLMVTGKDEMNLAEFPIAKIGRNDKKTTLEYEGWIVDKDGQRKHQKWVVSSSAAVGLPTEFAERILVALMSFTAQEKFESPKVGFSVYRILKTLGLSMNKRNYKAVEKALKQLVGLTIYSEGAFWDKAKKKRVTTLKGFHLIDDIWLRYMEDDEDVIDAEEANGYIVWSDRLWESFKAGYIKNLDTHFYYSLNSAVARRLFRFLDKRMHYQNEYQIDIYDLASRLGMAKYDKPSQVRRKLKPGLDELVERNYLDAYETVKVGKYTRLKFVKGGTRAVQVGLWEEVLTASDAPGELLEAISEPESTTSTQSRWSALYEVYGTPDELRNIWMLVLESFGDSSSRSAFTALEDSALLSVEDGKAVIGVESSWLDWVNLRLVNQIKRQIEAHIDDPINDIICVTESDGDDS